MNVTVIDNGGANLASLRNAFARLGVETSVTSNADAIRSAERLVLPGVGAAGDGMRRLRRAGLDLVLRELRQPVLGICLGMQLLYAHCEEDDCPGLGLLPGTVKRLRDGIGERVPHMGWNRLSLLAAHPLLEGIDGNDWFYFVHSYAAPIGACTFASSEHGNAFSALISRNNLAAVQFHPERSGSAGARLLYNFLGWTPCS